MDKGLAVAHSKRSHYAIRSGSMPLDAGHPFYALLSDTTQLQPSHVVICDFAHSLQDQGHARACVDYGERELVIKVGIAVSSSQLTLF